MIYKTALILAAALTATTVLAAPPVDKGRKERSTAIVIPSPPAGKGQIVFFRRPTWAGSGIGCSVHENGQKVSSLGNGRYFIAVEAPGRHEFSAQAETKDTVAVEVEPDETQFISCNMRAGIITYRPNLAPSNEAEFRAGSGFTMVDADDMGPGPGALRPSEVAAALAATAPSVPAAAPTGGVNAAVH